jgi:CheY-like chemotaxis protein
MKRIEPTLKGKKILVVEDDGDTAEVIGIFFRGLGAEVTAVSSVHDGFASIRKSKPDIVVSDLTLPDIDGFSFIATLRSLSAEEGGQIPAIALTGHVAEAIRTRVLASGFQGYLAKPFDVDELAVVVSTWIGTASR